MATAPATAARTIFRYAHPGGGVADAGAVFDARGAMDLHVSSEGDIAELCNFVPADLPVKRCSGDTSGPSPNQLDDNIRNTDMNYLFAIALLSFACDHA
ncbi:hypothetical protein AB1Y20_022256 [Prymnesium parvum]|uniref:Uncharacterized protein n=1 Tax=Prymnesium parvum TaxID=97485 RepID=A0AB34JIU6_PRYPA